MVNGHINAASTGPRGRSDAARGEAAAMPRSAAIDEQDLERALLRRSVGVLADARPQCADCGRTPLIGETVHLYARGTSVCELCRPLRRGEPELSERVRHSEAGLTVRVRRLPRA